MEIEGEVDEISDLARRLTDERTTIVRSVVKPTIARVPKEESEAPKPYMPTKEDVANFILSKGEHFKHTMREIELHFFERLYDPRVANEKSPYDQIYTRIVKARDIVQKTHGGEWKNRRTPTNEREYWLEKGEKQQTVDNYQLIT